MAIAFVNSGHWQGGANGGTSAAINMTGGAGANFFIIATAYFASSPALTVSDSVNGSAYTRLTDYTDATTGIVFHYAQNASNGASQTFTVTGTSFFGGMAVLGFSGVKTSSAFDTGTDSGATSSVGAATLAAGLISVTINHLIVTAAQTDNTTAPTVSDSSPGSGITYTLQESLTFSPGVNEGIYLAYAIAPSTHNADASWTGFGGTHEAVNEAAFAPPAAGFGPESLGLAKFNEVRQDDVQFITFRRRLAYALGRHILAPVAA